MVWNFKFYKTAIIIIKWNTHKQGCNLPSSPTDVTADGLPSCAVAVVSCQELDNGGCP